VEWLKVKALSLNPSTAKEKEKERRKSSYIKFAGTKALLPVYN
jgi:hypothetical protein